MKRAGVLVLLGGLALACREEHGPSEPPGLVDQAGHRVPEPTTPAAKPPEESAPKAPIFDELPTSARSQAPAEPTQAQSTKRPQTAAAVEERDLTEELLALFPTPPECLALGQLPPDTKLLVINAEAMVMPSGRISRVRVTAPGQPAETLSCIEAHISRGALKSDVPNAPILVRASLPLELTAQEN